MKCLLSLILSFIVCSAYGQTEVLKFNDDHKFKIVQFTDVHYISGRVESAVSIELINEVLDAEKPDLVVFTGDVVWGQPSRQILDEVFEPVVDRKIPWAYIFGNHDDEFEMSRSEIMDYATLKPYCLAQAGDKSIGGVGNYIFEIKGTNDNKTQALLYLMDSHAYSKVKGVGGYDWFTFDQIQWYRNQSKAYTKSNEGTPYPALAFFHIPLAEYPLMSADSTKIIGTKGEGECNGRLNSGMFTAMREAGDVMGTFVGHDHDNDYIGNYFDIYLAYGRYSGGKTVYNNLGLNGCRIIELQEGKREFKTYIRLLGGQKLYPVEYPTTFPLSKDKN